MIKLPKWGRTPDAPKPGRGRASEAPSPAAKPAAPPPLPDDFLFGSSIAGYQVEKGLHGADWHQWESKKKWFGRPRIDHDDRADNGPDFAHVNPDGTPGGKFVEYIAQAKAMGHNAFRFSLEWSRIQPAPGAPYDRNALRLYRAILDECRKQGLEPMVTLQHFTLPQWVNDVRSPEQGLGGWAGPKGSVAGEAPIVAAFEKFAGDMVEEFGDAVTLWITLNEPNLLAAGAYLAKEQPGPAKLDPAALRRAYVNMAHGHARAYDAMKAAAERKGVEARIGIAQHVRKFEPANPRSKRDQAAAEQLAYLNNALQLDAATSGDVDSNGDGRFDGPGEGKGIAALRDRLDFVGINYYSRDKVKALPFPLPLGDFRLKGVPWSALLPMIPLIGKMFETEDRTDVGWEIHPEGFYDTLQWAQERYQLPIYVTENGIADAKAPDERRVRFLLDHVEQMQRAKADGVDVRGYMHWSLMDNFEWGMGFRPRFGLLSVDLEQPDRPWRETDGARVYTDIIEAHGVTPEVRAAARPGRADDEPSRG